MQTQMKTQMQTQMETQMQTLQQLTLNAILNDFPSVVSNNTQVNDIVQLAQLYLDIDFIYQNNSMLNISQQSIEKLHQQLIKLLNQISHIIYKIQNVDEIHDITPVLSTFLHNIDRKILCELISYHGVRFFRGKLPSLWRNFTNPFWKLMVIELTAVWSPHLCEGYQTSQHSPSEMYNVIRLVTSYHEKYGKNYKMLSSHFKMTNLTTAEKKLFRSASIHFYQGYPPISY